MHAKEVKTEQLYRCSLCRTNIAKGRVAIGHKGDTWHKLCLLNFLMKSPPDFDEAIKELERISAYVAAGGSIFDA